jgi:hypothetical protein
MQVKDLVFTEQLYDECADILYTCLTGKGRITVLDRETGYGFGNRDTETGFTCNSGKFWLVSGNFDIRRYPELSVDDAVDLIKYWANTCIGE